MATRNLTKKFLEIRSSARAANRNLGKSGDHAETLLKVNFPSSLSSSLPLSSQFLSLPLRS